MAIKGQKFKHKPQSLKFEAIRLHIDEGWSYSKITDHLEVYDKDRVKAWMRKYRKMGAAAFEDRRGDPHKTETAQERELRRLYLVYHVEKIIVISEEILRKGCNVFSKRIR